MAWLLVVVAGLLETGFAVCLKLSHGFTRLWPTIAFAVFALGSFGLLTLSLKKLDVGPAYAVWTGIGAAGTAIYGMVFLGDLVSDPETRLDLAGDPRRHRPAALRLGALTPAQYSPHSGSPRQQASTSWATPRRYHVRQPPRRTASGQPAAPPPRADACPWPRSRTAAGQRRDRRARGASAGRRGPRPAGEAWVSSRAQHPVSAPRERGATARRAARRSTRGRGEALPASAPARGAQDPVHPCEVPVGLPAGQGPGQARLAAELVVEGLPGHPGGSGHVDHPDRGQGRRQERREGRFQQGLPGCRHRASPATSPRADRPLGCPARVDGPTDPVKGARGSHRGRRSPGPGESRYCSAMPEYDDDLRLAHVLADAADAATMERFRPST